MELNQNGGFLLAPALSGDAGQAGGSSSQASIGSGSNTGMETTNYAMNQTSTTDPYSYAGNLYHIPSNNLPPDNGIRQQKNTCVFCSVSAAYNYFGGHTTGLNILHLFAQNKQNHLSDRDVDAIMDKGVGYTTMLNVINQFLCASPTSTIIDGLAQGDPVFAVFNVSPIMNHAVLITGFSFFIDGPNAGFNYAFWNPATGIYGYKNTSSFFSTFTISGSK